MNQDPMVTHAEVSTKVSSATTPALLLSFAAMSAGLALLIFGPDNAAQFGIGLLIGGPVLAALQIVFFTFFDRDRLHTERHLEQRAIIERMPPAIGDSKSVRVIEGSGAVRPNPAMGGDDAS
ncbi:hypothetical protein [Erythrobacter sp.]|uniref:hypothetical protein n=1 Tax=Erythrobacter sp. TaxID=1042 RepID=UPI00311FA8D3